MNADLHRSRPRGDQQGGAIEKPHKAISRGVGSGPTEVVSRPTGEDANDAEDR